MTPDRTRCARVLSRAQLGLGAPQVQVEAQVGRGLPNFNIVGLPAPVVRESRERVRAAIISSGFEYPVGRITLNLAPVELSKQGGRFDLPIALAVLAASGQLRVPRSGIECYGELGLGGELRPVGGLFLAALHAQLAGHSVIVPTANCAEVLLSGHAGVSGADTLREAAEHFGCRPRARAKDSRQAAARADAGAMPAAPETAPVIDAPRLSLAEVVGQIHVKRALIVAAAGGHSVLMIGPPGSGKSMLAQRLPELLPPLSAGEALEVASIASTAGIQLQALRFLRRPFRAPHHSASTQAIVGGGPQIRPGEITLAHHGVLFLDELPEFDRRVLESLREPLETGAITIARAAARLEMPARFQLIAAMNPCPCGYFGDAAGRCHCGRRSIELYRQRISGPLLDRIDIRVEVPRMASAEFLAPLAGRGERADHQAAGAGACAVPEDPAEALALVQRAQQWRLSRSGCLSARLDAAQLQRCCALTHGLRVMLEHSAEELTLSGRGMHRLLTLARTIADLANSEHIEPPHLTEAVELRPPIESATCAGGTL
ncbi:MAG: YifB family Mg chelatase-like AAA ATPase [Steroidobacteraceae bacterium]